MRRVEWGKKRSQALSKKGETKITYIYTKGIQKKETRQQGEFGKEDDETSERSLRAKDDKETVWKKIHNGSRRYNSKVSFHSPFLCQVIKIEPNFTVNY